MLILGIETSCDETAAALVEDGIRIISSTVASSQALHLKTKGVIPEVAAREQVKCIIPVIEETFRRSDLRGGPTSSEIDAIAVTNGPGLIGSLLVGVETAKTLAYIWNKPIIPINHLLGHVYTNFVCHPESAAGETKDPVNFSKIFPTIVLLVSGGHTELLLMKDHAAPAYATRKRCGRGKFQWLGGTRDDASGECFDKCARILGLPYPGGPSIEKEASKFLIRNSQFDNLKIKLPRPMINQDNFDFSFSGLKTALLNNVKQFSNLTIQQFIPYFAFEIQEAIIDVLVAKTIRAANQYQVKSIIIGGGVTANQRLREKFKEKVKNYSLLMPEKTLSTDNAVGIASAAFFNFHPLPWQEISADPSLEIC